MLQKKILITGASGFIGSNIVKNISKANKIFIISRDKKKKNNQKNLKFINYEKFDELNSKLKKIKIDIVIHCATHYVKEHSYNDIQRFANSNILLSTVYVRYLRALSRRFFERRVIPQAKAAECWFSPSERNRRYSEWAIAKK